MLIIVLASTQEIRSLNALVRPTGSSLPQCQWWSAFPEMVVSPAFSQDDTLFSWGFDYNLDRAFIIKSTDRGISWTISTLMDRWAIVDIALSPDYLQDRTAYVANIASSLTRTVDGGQTWATIPNSQTQGVPSLAVVATNTLFLGVGGGPPYLEPQQGIFYTADGGQTWERFYQDGVTEVAVSPNFKEDHTVFMGIGEYHWNGGILKSTDGGHTWQPSREGLAWGSDGATTDITFSPGYTQDHTMFTVSWAGLYKSTDEGAHWMRLAPLPESAPGTVTGYVISPRYPQDQTLWLSGYAEGNLVSMDGGSTWRSLPESVVPIAAGAYCPLGSLGLCQINLFGYAWDKDYHDYMFKSFDGGTTWHCLESDYTPPPMLPRAFLPVVGKR